MANRRTGPGEWAAQANRAAHEAVQRVDDTTGETSARAAGAITGAVRLLRWPTALLLWVPIPFIATTVLIGLLADGPAGVVITILGGAMAIVSALFWGRRHRILSAVQEPALLAGELRTMMNLTGRIDETGVVLHEIAGGQGWQVLGRLRGLWRGAQLPAHWIDQVGDLPRARYFAPPKIGTTVMIAMAAVWLVPISVVVTVFAAIGALAGSL